MLTDCFPLPFARVPCPVAARQTPLTVIGSACVVSMLSAAVSWPLLKDSVPFTLSVRVKHSHASPVGQVIDAQLPRANKPVPTPRRLRAVGAAANAGAPANVIPNAAPANNNFFA